MSAQQGRWWVTCPEFRAGPYRSQASAEKGLEDIERTGACKWQHVIEAPTDSAQPTSPRSLASA